MLPLKYLFENFDLAKECLKLYDHSERHLDEMLRYFRISSNAVYPFCTENGTVCFLRLSPPEEEPEWMTQIIEKQNDMTARIEAFFSAV